MGATRWILCNALLISGRGIGSSVHNWSRSCLCCFRAIQHRYAGRILRLKSGGGWRTPRPRLSGGEAGSGPPGECDCVSCGAHATVVRCWRCSIGGTENAVRTRASIQPLAARRSAALWSRRWHRSDPSGMGIFVVGHVMFLGESDCRVWVRALAIAAKTMAKLLMLSLPTVSGDRPVSTASMNSEMMLA